MGDEIHRYSQQIKLENIGLEGQAKLKNAKILCVGAGGLGSSLLLYLTAAGVGTIAIVDDDCIELSNLQRQILYKHKDIGLKKIIKSKEVLLELNEHTNIQMYPEKLEASNAKKLISQYDIIADCSDNFVTKYLINDVCYLLNKPYVFASASQYQGQCSIFLGYKSPCLRCLFPSIPIENSLNNCSETGVLGVLPGLLGIIQATEMIKWILNIGESLANSLLTVDLLEMDFKKYHLEKNPECKLCALKEPLESISYPPEKYNILDHIISVKELRSKLNRGDDVFLLDVRTSEENKRNNLGGTLIPLLELKERVSELPFDKPIIVYCQAGPRSIQAIKILMENNFQSIQFLKGGLIAWENTLEA